MSFSGARRDADGFLWVTGRVDDMLNVSGHLMSTAEVESVLTEHPSVAEAAVVAKPHPVKGECLYCFITTTEHAVFDSKLTNELKQLIREDRAVRPTGRRPERSRTAEDQVGEDNEADTEEDRG